jgi:hypothetical protein
MAIVLEKIEYWGIVLIPFAVAINSAPMNICMGLMLFGFLLMRILRKRPFLPRSSSVIPLVILFIITCISAVNSVCLKDTLRGGIARLLQYALVFFALSTDMKDARHVKRIFFAMCLGLCLTGINEIWQVIGGTDFIRGNTVINNLGVVRATSSFSDANILGVYLSALFPVVFAVSWHFYRGYKRLILYLSTAL